LTDVLLDQYYTQKSVAQSLYNRFLQIYGSVPHLMIEPAAGTGAFFELMPKGSIGIDVDPRYPGIWRADFLTVQIQSAQKIAIIGNPPFGKNASMALKFFNHGASMANVMAFILPRSFRKASIKNRLDQNFHLVYEEDVPEHAFLFRGLPYNVPAVFQVWERRPTLRPLITVETRHPDFEFTNSTTANFAIQRVGARAGRVHRDFARSPSAHYFIRGQVEPIMRQLDFASVVLDTAGNPSLAKSEIVSLYKFFVEGIGQARRA